MRFDLRRIVKGVLALVGIPFFCIAGEVPYDIQGDSGMTIGFGYDAIKDEAKGECVNFSGKEEVNGFQSSIEINQIENSSNLFKEMNLSSSASAKFAVGAGASLKASFAFSREINSYSTFVLVKSVVRTPVVVARDVSIKSAYDKYFGVAGGATKFREKCGDYYVSGYSAGGEFYGVIQIESNSNEEKNNLETSLKGGYGSFSGEAELKSKISTVLKNKNVNIRVYSGGGIPQILKADVDGLIDMASKFPTKFLDSGGKYNGTGVINSILLKPYYELPSSYDITNGSVDIQNQIRIVDRYTDLLMNYEKYINDVNYILKYPAKFKGPQIKELVEFKGRVIDKKNKVIENIRNCYRGVDGCKDDQDLNYFTEILPGLISANDCKKPIYNEKSDPLCGIIFNSGTGSECGQLCGVQNDVRCGIAKYNTGTGSVCGVVWREAQTKSCGETQSPKEVSCREHESGCHCYDVGGEPVGKWGKTPIKCKKMLYFYKSCRHPDHGLEGYGTCENPVFGVKEYNKCQICDGFATCRHPNFGIEKINTCRLPQFGLERCAD